VHAVWELAELSASIVSVECIDYVLDLLREGGSGGVHTDLMSYAE
jgi:hypothetical protein